MILIVLSIVGTLAVGFVIAESCLAVTWLLDRIYKRKRK